MVVDARRHGDGDPRRRTRLPRRRRPARRAAPATRAAVEEIPPERLRIYQAAGRRFDIDWTFLASIGYQECGQGACPDVNASGCAGPMQIAYVRGIGLQPGLGADDLGTLQGRRRRRRAPSVFDPADAIFTAARILRQTLGAPPAGGSYAAYRQAACDYYGACGDSVANYADEVMARAVEYGFRGKGSPPPDGPQARPSPPRAGGGGAGTCGGAASAASASGNEIVRIAESQLGRAESPLGSNCNPYGPCVEWCSLFVAWVWEKAGVPLKGGTAPYAYSGSIYEWAKAHEGGPSLPGAAAPGESAVLPGRAQRRPRPSADRDAGARRRGPLRHRPAARATTSHRRARLPRRADHDDRRQLLRPGGPRRPVPALARCRSRGAGADLRLRPAPGVGESAEGAVR